MKKVLTIVSIALFGATLGFACGGGQQPASTLPTGPAVEETTPSTTGAEGVTAVGGDSYGGVMYGGVNYGGDEGW